MTYYRRGADHERRTKAKLESLGYVVLRSAGSHSLVDLAAKMPNSEEPWLLIQCGLGKKSKREREGLVNLARSLGAVPVLVGRGQRFTFIGEKFEVEA
jgi:Holliday junction resolvase